MNERCERTESCERQRNLREQAVGKIERLFISRAGGVGRGEPGRLWAPHFLVGVEYV